MCFAIATSIVTVNLDAKRAVSSITVYIKPSCSCNVQIVQLYLMLTCNIPARFSFGGDTSESTDI